LYFDVGPFLIAQNRKVCTQSIFSALYRKFGDVPPMTDSADKPVYFLMRDPVDRFRSALFTLKACGLEHDPDTVLSGSIEDDPHLWPQIRYVPTAQPLHMYRFPFELDQFVKDCELAPFPHLNPSENRVPLTPIQMARVRKLYEQDLALFNR
jgi:hypothetical protein